MRTSDGPWWNSRKNSWYCKIRGRNISLRCQKHEKREAVRRWAALVSGQKPIESPRRSESLTVRECLEAFLADVCLRAKPTTISGYRGAASTLIRGLGDLPVRKLTPTVAIRFVHSAKRSRSYRSGLLRLLRTATNFAVQNGMLAESPLKGLRIPANESRGEKAVVTSQDFGRILEHSGEPFRHFLTFLWETGCRPGEAARLAAENVDLERGIAKLTEHKTDHTGKPRVLFLSDQAVRILRPLTVRHPAGLLFRTPKGRPWRKDRISQMAAWVSRRCGIHFTCYGLRHSAATRWLKAGMPLVHASALLGHATVAVTVRHYAHVREDADALRSALERFGG